MTKPHFPNLFLIRHLGFWIFPLLISPFPLFLGLRQGFVCSPDWARTCGPPSRGAGIIAACHHTCFRALAFRSLSIFSLNVLLTQKSERFLFLPLSFFSFFFCMCMCYAFMCVCTLMCMCPCVCVFMQRPKVNIRCFSPLYLLELSLQCTSLNPELNQCWDSYAPPPACRTRVFSSEPFPQPWPLVLHGFLCHCCDPFSVHFPLLRRQLTQ